MARRCEVALIVDPSKPYDRRIIRGVAAFVRHHRCEWSLYVEEDPVGRLPHLDAWAGDGIVANYDDRRIATAVNGANVPVVAIGGGYGYYTKNPRIPYVRTDNRAIAKLAAQHLLDLGHRRFAICGEPPNKFNGWAAERADAFAAHVRAAGHPCDVYTGRYVAARQWRGSQRDLWRWLGTLDPPVGMMAANDGRALHVLQACRAAQLRVPDDVAIVGVDNDDVMCDVCSPPLTSVEQGARRIGFEAAALLNVMMNGGAPSRRLTAVPPEGLVARQSTDVLATSDADVAEALRFIRRRACDPITVRDVLETAKLSRSTLEARFREALGRSIHAEIRRVQLEAAKRLLATTNAPLKEVARQAGFSTVQYFTAVFREATGHTPGVARAEARV
jgi:LacI family transcriptional regulator